MIFVTVGTQIPFDRLVRTVDDWAGRTGRKDVFAQIGESRHVPRHLEAVASLDPDEFAARFDAADVVVAHAGMGTILGALVQAKPLLVMPRRASLGEHRNEHQLATAQRFQERGLVHVAIDEQELAAALEGIDGLESLGRISERASDELLAAIRDFIG